MPVAWNAKVSPASAGFPFNCSFGMAARSDVPERTASACPLCESLTVKIRGLFASIEPASGLDRPAAVSTAMLSAPPAASEGHSRSTRSADADRTGTLAPFTRTRVPPSSVLAPEGSASGIAPPNSQFPRIAATAPGLHSAGAVRTGKPEPTSSFTVLVAAAPNELVAVKLRP